MTTRSGKSCSVIRVTVRVFREHLQNFACVSFFPFGIDYGMWDMIVLIPDHSIYFHCYNS